MANLVPLCKKFLYIHPGEFMNMYTPLLAILTVFGFFSQTFCLDAFKKMPLIYENGDSIFEFSGKLRIDAFYGKNLKLLNNDNPTDRVLLPGGHTLDLNFMYSYGRASHDYDVMKVKGTLRNKSTWGDPESIASTGFSTIRDLDAVIGDHNHPIPVNFPIIRELWMQMVLNDVLNLDFTYRHYFTMGLFPFQLGRGIALGDAYATVPDFLGYNPANAVQQYAPAFKLSGALAANDALVYDLYAAILDNRSDTFDNVNLNILGQQYGHRFNQARGFGIINYILAGRLRWFPFDAPGKKLSFEPYALYDDEREQKIEFLGDASSKLGTLGLAMEGEFGDFEIGFDMAFNVGRQEVKGWDRNIIVKELRNAIPTFVNDKVLDSGTGKKALFIPANQAIIDSSIRQADQNGKIIDASTLRNDINRFTDPYTNKYGGSMMVFDVAYWLCRPDIKIAAATGFATGDENPNRDLNDPHDSDIDGQFDGFISLQERYSGTRVRSAYLLSGSGKIPRVLSFPSADLQGDRFASTVSRFTNIIFAGSALWLKARTCNHTWDINPNIIAYWQEHQTKAFDIAANQTSATKFARRYLGLELNIFIETMLLPDLKFFTVAALFVPGGHFDDIKGRPITKDQQKFLDAVIKTGIANTVPLVGADPSYFFNIGLEYKF